MGEDARKRWEEEQTHVHEFLGSTRLAELEEEPHNHRFAGVSGQVKCIGDDHHIHEIITRTDFFEDHFHEICVRSCQEVCVSDDKHVHFVSGTTEEADGHVHTFVFATLIENPIGECDCPLGVERPGFLWEIGSRRQNSEVLRLPDS